MGSVTKPATLAATMENFVSVFEDILIPCIGSPKEQALE
jgi:hypothetical protein